MADERIRRIGESVYAADDVDAQQAKLHDLVTAMRTEAASYETVYDLNGVAAEITKFADRLAEILDGDA